MNDSTFGIVSMIVLTLVLTPVVLYAHEAFQKLVGRFRRTYYYRRFPPISEAEFVHRCNPGVDRAVALCVRRIIGESLDIAYDEIYPEHRLSPDLGCD